MKEYFLNLMKPCCNLSYLEMREFINAVEFNSEENRQEVLQGVTQKGTLTQEAWMLFIGSVPLNDTINLELLQEWSGSECKLTCEQWQRVIGGVYFDTNYYIEPLKFEAKIKKGVNIETILINTEENFKDWLEYGVDSNNNYLNVLQNIKIEDFRVEDDINTGIKKIKCNLFADGSQIGFSDNIHFVIKIGKVKNLESLNLLGVSNLYLSQIISDLSELKKIKISHCWSFQNFDNKKDMQSLEEIRIDNVSLAEGFVPKGNFPNLRFLEIQNAYDMRWFKPTAKMPNLKYLFILGANSNFAGWDSTNWTWFIPDNGKAYFYNCNIEKTPVYSRLLNKNWNVNF